MSRFSELKAQGRFVRFPTPRSRIKGHFRGDAPRRPPHLGDGMRFQRQTVTHAAFMVAAIIGLSACDAPSSNAATETTSTQISPPAKALNLGKWQVSESVDPMTDRKIIRVIQQANDTDVVLSIACSKENAWVHIAWNEFLGGQQIGDITSTKGDQFELKDVTYRIGDGQPVTSEMLVLADRTTTQVDGAVALIEKVRAANRLVLQTQPYNENPKTVVFDTTGLTEILNAKRPECDWYVRDIIRAEYAEKKRFAEEEAKNNPLPPPTAPEPQKPLRTPDPDALIK